MLLYLAFDLIASIRAKRIDVVIFHDERREGAALVFAYGVGRVVGFQRGLRRIYKMMRTKEFMRVVLVQGFHKRMTRCAGLQSGNRPSVGPLPSGYG